MTFLRSILTHFLDPRSKWARLEEQRMAQEIERRGKIVERMQELLRTTRRHTR